MFSVSVRWAGRCSGCSSNVTPHLELSPDLEPPLAMLLSVKCAHLFGVRLLALVADPETLGLFAKKAWRLERYGSGVPDCAVYGSQGGVPKEELPRPLRAFLRVD